MLRGRPDKVEQRPIEEDVYLRLVIACRAIGNVQLEQIQRG